MKTEERKKEDCKLLDEFRHHWLNSHRLKYFYESDKLMIDERLNQFKADNDLLPKPELEFNRWIVADTDEKWIAFYTVGSIYGVDSNGDWFSNDYTANPTEWSSNRYATEAEILEKLSAVAVEMGYTEGVKVESLFERYKDIVTGKFFMDVDGLWADCKTYNILIMENGEWAKIISTPNQELSKEEWNERIGEVQVKINELEEKLNELRKLV